MRDGLRERGLPLETPMIDWGGRMATRLLADAASWTPWVNVPLPKATADPWDWQTRRCEDGREARLMSSHPHGEQLTGRLQSAPFKLPAQLSFYLCGHHGYPGKPDNRLNRVRLLDARTGAVLREVHPPRHDTARRVVWQFEKERGREVMFEAVDGDPAGAYAWLAFGRFEPALPELELKTARAISDRLASGAALAGDLKLNRLQPQLRIVLLNRRAGGAARVNAARAYVALADPIRVEPVVAALLKDRREPLGLRVALVSAAAPVRALHADVLTAFAAAPAGEQVRFARALADHAHGARALLDAAEKGRVPAQLLLDDEVRLRLPEGMLPRVAILTRGLQAASPDTAKLIAGRLAFFREQGGDAIRGAAVFKAACVVCHAKGGQGGNIGPQLDGLGSRGAERVVEDILDPHRNVDPTFRYSTVKLKDGQTLLGLQRRAVGQAIVFADVTGKEITVPKAAIVSRTPTAQSLMPAALGAALPEKDFAALLAYLLAK